MSLKRQEKVMSPAEAAAFIKDGSTLVIGGFVLQNKPMVMIRALLKAGTKDLFLVTSGPGSVEVDTLIGAGRLRRLASCSVNLERIAPVAPHYRRCVESGKLDLWECGEGTIIAALRASIQGLPFLPTRSGLGTDLLKVNPDLRVFQDPVAGEQLVAVPAIRPDVAIVLTRRSDPYGNAQYGGMAFWDQLATMASRQVIVVTEEVVAPEVIRADPARTRVVAESVVAVVEAPYGAHPCASHGCYPFDEEAVEEYLAAARTPEAFKSYLDKYVYGVEDHEGYLEQVGIRRLLGLKAYRKG